MTASSVARRYANALFREAASVPRIHEDMEMIRETLELSRDLALCMESPVIPRERKLAVAESLFASRTHALTMRFVRLVVRGKREGLLLEITRAYRRLREESEGIVHAHVRTAAPLGAHDLARLRQTLERQTGKRVVAAVEMDANLIGGIVVRIGDVVYDGSVRHQLQRLRGRLEAES